MRQIYLVWLVLMCSTPLSIAVDSGPELTLHFDDAYHSMFAGKETLIHVGLQARQAGTARLGWEFSVENRIVSRGQQNVELVPDRRVRVALSLAVPALRPGLRATGTVRVVVLREHGNATIERNLILLSPEVFVERQAQLQQLNIQLFDPTGTTAPSFSDAQLPFALVQNRALVTSSLDRLLIVGAGTSFRRQRNLWPDLVTAAARGQTILCLTPGELDVELPGYGGAPLAPPVEVALRKADIVTELDAKLDAEAWSPQPNVAAKSFVLQTSRDRVMAVLEPTPEHWLWLELRFASGGRLILTTLAIVEGWSTAPSARYVLLAILDKLYAPEVNDHQAVLENH